MNAALADQLAVERAKALDRRVDEIERALRLLLAAHVSEPNPTPPVVGYELRVPFDFTTDELIYAAALFLAMASFVIFCRSLAL